MFMSMEFKKYTDAQGTTSQVFQIGKEKIRIGSNENKEPILEVFSNGEWFTIKLGVSDTRTHEPQYNVKETDIPNVKAVWEMVSRVKSALESRINDVDNWKIEIEGDLSDIIGNFAAFDPGSWDD